MSSCLENLLENCTYGEKMIPDLQSFSRIIVNKLEWPLFTFLFTCVLEVVDNSGLQQQHNDDSQHTAPCLLISSVCFFLTSDFLFSLMWQHGSFNQLAHLELSL